MERRQYLVDVVSGVFRWVRHVTTLGGGRCLFTHKYLDN
jgi:hypothetical protein